MAELVFTDGLVTGLLICVLHSARVPSQPQPQPFFGSVDAGLGAAAAGAAAAVGADAWDSPLPPLVAVRIRSWLWIDFLPPVDIACRRASEASRATETELLAGAEYELTAGAAVRTGALVAVDAAGRAFAEGREAPPGRPALPVVDIALRRARTSSRVLLYAIVNPIASWLFQSLTSCPPGGGPKVSPLNGLRILRSRHPVSACSCRSR